MYLSLTFDPDGFASADWLYPVGWEAVYDVHVRWSDRHDCEVYSPQVDVDDVYYYVGELMFPTTCTHVKCTWPLSFYDRGRTYSTV